jgi:hypothetical protein
VAQIKVVVERAVNAPAEKVLALLADYSGMRGELWPEMITDYRVVEGGTGAGTRIAYRLHATRKRIRDVEAIVSEAHAPGGAAPGGAAVPGILVESDQRSSLRTAWRVEPAQDGCLVSVTTSWAGAGGVGGFFEKIFAPIGIRRLWNGVLDNLEQRLG